MEDTEVEKFEKLKLLLAKGIITQEQYEKKKEDLVDLFLKSQQSGDKKESKSDVQSKSGKLDKQKSESKGSMRARTEEKRKEKQRSRQLEGTEILGHFKQAIAESEKRGPGEYGEEHATNAPLATQTSDGPSSLASPTVNPDPIHTTSSPDGKELQSQPSNLISPQPSSAALSPNTSNNNSNNSINAHSSSTVPILIATSPDQTAITVPLITTTISAVTNESSLTSPRMEHVTVVQGDSVTVFQKAIQHKALFAYHPSAPDELELVVGQIVSVTAIFDDGWMKGFNDKNNEGVFPANYVEIMKVTPKSVTPTAVETKPADYLVDLCDQIWGGNLQLVKEGIRRGDITAEMINNYRNSRGQSMVYLASRAGHHSILRYLISIPKVDVNGAQEAKGSTPLHGACFGGSAPTVALLLAWGARYDAKNSFGNTAFDEKNAKINDLVRSFQEGSQKSLLPYMACWSGLFHVFLHTGIGWPHMEPGEYAINRFRRAYD